MSPSALDAGRAFLVTSYNESLHLSEAEWLAQADWEVLPRHNPHVRLVCHFQSCAWHHVSEVDPFDWVTVGLKPAHQHSRRLLTTSHNSKEAP